MSTSTINNFDTSSKMEDCELHCFYDDDVSRMDFEENFEVMEHDGYRTTALYFYVDYGNCEGPPSYASECYDFSKCSEKDFRAFVWECYCDQTAYNARSDYENAREMVDEMVTNHGTWKDYAISLIDEETVASYVKDDDWPEIENAELIVESVSVTGYSQGDYANILFWTSSIWDSINPETKEPLPRDQVVSTMQRHFHNLVFDQRIYCRLEVDGTEHYFDEHMKDIYEWDTDEIMTIAKEKFKLSESVLKWLEDNLPEYPSHA